MLVATALLDVWERGQSLPPAKRALQALAAWEGDRAAASSLPLDELNRRLLDMRSDVFGDRLEFFAECAECGMEVEFAVSVSSLRDTPDGETDARLELGELAIACRPPSTSDVMEASKASDARRALLERCVLEARSGSSVLPMGELPDGAIRAVEEFLDERHPLLDIAFAIECPECSHGWTETLDIASYLWDDIDLEARRLLNEVAILARAYGWSESDVLGMRARRRTHYLELVA